MSVRFPSLACAIALLLAASTASAQPAAQDSTLDNLVHAGGYVPSG